MNSHSTEQYNHIPRRPADVLLVGKVNPVDGFFIR